MISPLRFVSSLALLAIWLVTSLQGKPTKIPTIAEALAQSKIMTKMNELAVYAGLHDFLDDRTKTLTLFVPVDSSFSRYAPEQWAMLTQTSNQPEMQRIFLYHLLNGKRFYEKDMVTEKILSCQGSPLEIHRTTAGIITIQGAHMLRSDIRCVNGVIHQIDLVLTPPGPILTPIPTPTPTPSPTPSPTTSPTPTPSATPSPSPFPTDSPTPTPSPTETPTEMATPTPALNPSPTLQPSILPTQTPISLAPIPSQAPLPPPPPSVSSGASSNAVFPVEQQYLNTLSHSPLPTLPPLPSVEVPTTAPTPTMPPTPTPTQPPTATPQPTPSPIPTASGH